ncbi:precorrin-2 C(20)-methyltransferase [Desulfosporosinus meridiei]|uniref:Precorrin-2 C20-methyltransferase, cobalt-factor II C20-methyltransferase n=1 Tax=Desulfosporosinus meridiei (strain ATCC BAA-275 / DSM 13257 / KCTC 12902 / NCIMB 13706 / S10) TaxID=768704 RepID=J7IQI5_DESMD|nr:precorrin-2 C(20)-methyltransferase [Desulfosporosinus meridiei]AFQ44127.1 precorrin-2 C20-methyltransferase, cobalt-factor II C20-methyltransferase [Desulfosporosinus meridiei DSM 13257]
MNISWGKFYGVGVGPGDPQLLTLQAVEVLKSVDLVAVPKSKMDRESVAWDIAKVHCPSDARLMELEMPMTADQQVLAKAWQTGAEAILAELKQGKSVAFITLGDPSLYSTYSYLLNILQEQLPQECIKTIPGITAMAAAAAKINLPLATGDEPLLILPSTEDVGDYLNFPNLVLMKVSRRLPDILTLLEKRERKAVLLTRLGQAEERIRWEPKPEDFKSEKVDYLSLLLVKKDLLGRENSEPKEN